MPPSIATHVRSASRFTAPTRYSVTPARSDERAARLEPDLGLGQTRLGERRPRRPGCGRRRARRRPSPARPGGGGCRSRRRGRRRARSSRARRGSARRTTRAARSSRACASKSASCEPTWTWSAEHVEPAPSASASSVARLVRREPELRAVMPGADRLVRVGVDPERDPHERALDAGRRCQGRLVGRVEHDRRAVAARPRARNAVVLVVPVDDELARRAAGRDARTRALPPRRRRRRSPPRAAVAARRRWGTPSSRRRADRPRSRAPQRARPRPKRLLAEDDERRPEPLGERRAPRRRRAPARRRRRRAESGNRSSIRRFCLLRSTRHDDSSFSHSAGSERGDAAPTSPEPLDREAFLYPERRCRRWSGWRRYDPQAIEAKWQRVWEDEQAFVVPNPEPGALRGRGARRTSSRCSRTRPATCTWGTRSTTRSATCSCTCAVAAGLQVLRPMGYDAFGLPAENAAIKEGGHPREVTERNIATIREQMRRMGWAIDWSRELSTHDPAYYRWTQWLFLRFFERGLAYRKEAPVKWCPNDQTVLANEQVIDGRCERCGSGGRGEEPDAVVLPDHDYADALLDEMELLEQWPERVLTMQRNWIGRSQGARVLFRVEGTGEELPVFTTRPDTLFGATFFVLAPEHPLVPQLVAGHRARGGGARLRAPRRGPLGGRARGEGEGRRLHRPLRGQPRQRRVDPDLGRRLRADGATAPARSWPCPPTTSVTTRSPSATGSRSAGRRARPTAIEPETARSSRTPSDEVLVNSGAFTGLPAPEGKQRDHRLARGAGPGRGDDRLPAAGLAALAAALLGLPDPDRPLRRCGEVPVPDDQLPVLLPDVDDYLPKGRSPLAAAEDWVATTCPSCGGPGAARDRHDGHVRRLVLVLHPLLRPAQRRRAVLPRARRLLAARSTSTSAASSTRCCTCSTRASSRR